MPRPSKVQPGYTEEELELIRKQLEADGIDLASLDLESIDPYTYHGPDVVAGAGRAMERAGRRIEEGLTAEDELGRAAELIPRLLVTNPLKGAGAALQVRKPEVEAMVAGAKQAAQAVADDPIGVGKQVAGKVAEADFPMQVAEGLSISDLVAPMSGLGKAAAAMGMAAALPSKTVRGYKLFRTEKGKEGEIFPLFVDADTPVAREEWVEAIAGTAGKDPGKVKSKIGDLAYRPGWHAGDAPIATHIGGKSTPELKKPDYRPASQIWAEVEMSDDVDWQKEAIKRAKKTKGGDIIPKTAHITDQVPKGGHYRYKTNPNMEGEWLIGGEMKVGKQLSAEELSEVRKASNVKDLPSLPELIERKGLRLADLTETAREELQTYYPKLYAIMTTGH